MLTELPQYSDYINIRNPTYISHSAGKYAAKRFRKAQCPIIERLTNSLMMNGRNNGKKLMAVRIVAHAFEIVRPTSSTCACAYQYSQSHTMTNFSATNRSTSQQTPTHCKSPSTPSSTAVPAKTAHVLVQPVPSVVKPSMSLLSAASTRPSL